MTAPVTHFLPVTLIRRARMLAVPGRVTIRKGQKVNANDVIAEGNLTPEHIFLDIARGLGLPANKADTYIQRHTGDEVAQGDVIAGPVGMARRIIRAPRAGRIVLTGNGQVLMETESRPFELKAGLPGVVIDLIPDRGAVIEATGALIQGVWGNGRVDVGLLSVLAQTPQDALTFDRLDVSQRGLVVFAGYCDDAQILQNAAEIPLRGIILGSIDPALIPIAMKMNYPIMVIEGFGHIPVNPVAYKLITTNERREVVVIADVLSRLEGIRPELVIPLPASSQVSPPNETDHFSPGQQVRIYTSPYRGAVGTLIALRPGLVDLPSGIRVQAAEIRLENGENCVMPVANLEVLE